MFEIGLRIKIVDGDAENSLKASCTVKPKQ